MKGATQALLAKVAKAADTAKGGAQEEATEGGEPSTEAKVMKTPQSTKKTQAKKKTKKEKSK